MTVNFVIKQGLLHQRFIYSFLFYPFLVGWDLGEKLRGATRMLRIHEGGIGVKKVENYYYIMYYLQIRGCGLL